MDPYLLQIPQYSAMTQPSESSQFTSQLKVNVNLPKILAFSQQQSGNVFLYEINSSFILLVLPNGMEIQIDSVKKTNKAIPTPHGEKYGYVFYKNNTKHIETLNSLFNGDQWQSNLSEPLPEPLVEKTPILLFKGTISYNNAEIPVSFYEYSDKSLVLFSPVDISNRDDKLLKFSKNLVCLDSPSGKCNGYLIFKNNSKMISFIKRFINIPFESMYKKSEPKISTVIKQQSEGQLIDSKRFTSEDREFSLEVFEYSPLSIALFPNPIFNINGLNLTNNLVHPQHGKIYGYIVAKSNVNQIEMIERIFQFSNLSSKYVMNEDLTKGIVIAPPSGVMPLGPFQSDLSVNSFDDIPLETLIRIIQNKLNKTTGFVSKNLPIGDKIMLYGDEEDVMRESEIFDEMKVVLEVKTDEKKLRIFERVDI